MAVTIKSDREIELMREAGKILAEVHLQLKEFIKPGISTFEINDKADKLIRSYGCIPSFLGYQGFPASVCISVNEEVVHGIPRKDKILVEGDIVSIDAGLIHKDYHSDAARTWPVGEVSEDAKKIIEVTEQSFFEGIKFARNGNHLHEISAAIQEYVESHGLSVVRDLVGHGIGRQMHEAPQIPNFKQRHRGIRLQAGMTLAIEPMVNLGRYDVSWLDDDWTVVSRDGSLSAHYENTILITEDEPEILSL
jgi:methionyl aminopeptidase